MRRRSGRLSRTSPCQHAKESERRSPSHTRAPHTFSLIVAQISVDGCRHLHRGRQLQRSDAVLFVANQKRRADAWLRRSGWQHRCQLLCRARRARQGRSTRVGSGLRRIATAACRASCRLAWRRIRWPRPLTRRCVRALVRPTELCRIKDEHVVITVVCGTEVEMGASNGPALPARRGRERVREQHSVVFVTAVGEHVCTRPVGTVAVLTPSWLIALHYHHSWATAAVLWRPRPRRAYSMRDCGDRRVTHAPSVSVVART